MKNLNEFTPEHKKEGTIDTFDVIDTTDTNDTVDTFDAIFTGRALVDNA